MNGVVVPRAQRNLVVEVGPTTVLPVVDVMDLASVIRNVAVGNCTRGVHRLERPPLVDGCQAFGSSDIERDAVSTENHGDDLGLAGETPDRLDRNVDTIDGSAGRGRMPTMGERREIDVHDYFGT